METTQLSTADLANTANGRDREESLRNDDHSSTPLLPRDFSENMRTQWDRIQTAFVDDPQASVKEADELVASGIKKLAETFADERTKLEQEWSRGNDVSTEDLRLALRRYRAFFQRLLAV